MKEITTSKLLVDRLVGIFNSEGDFTRGSEEKYDKVATNYSSSF